MINYFALTDNYCWQWKEDGNIIELREGFTICYTDALLKILQELSFQGWPPLGSVLLILCACKEDPFNFELTIKQLQEQTQKAFYPDGPSEEYNGILQAVIRLLELIHTLPQKLRAEDKRGLLLKTLFEGISPQVNSADAIRELQLFYKYPHQSNNTIAYTLKKDLSWLYRASKRVADMPALRMLLETSIEQIPAPLPLTLPPPAATDLLTSLSEYEQTAGISRLAKHILAAIHVPMHTHNSGDRSLGGISDITNKGTYDRLLLSELAQDDAVLTARLANNEALYLRREELPSQRKKKVIILIDITLKMWGTPRAFAMAAALACREQQNKDSAVHTWMMGGHHATAVSLDNRQGVIHALTLLDDRLELAPSLSAFLQERPEEGECYLITSEQQAQHPALQHILAVHPHPVDFLLTVDRNGAFHCYHYSGGRKKLISQALFDLNEILFSSSAQNSSGKTDHWLKENPPLRFAITHMKNEPGNHFRKDPKGDSCIVSITRDGRVQYRDTFTHHAVQQFGALECCRSIEQGEYHILFMSLQEFSILVSSPFSRTLILYHFSHNGITFTYKRIETKAIIGKYTVVTRDGYFCLYPSHWLLHGTTGELEHNLDNRQPNAVTLGIAAAASHKKIFKELSKCYFALPAINDIFICSAGKLIIEKRSLYLDNKRNSSEVLLRLSDKKEFTVGRAPVSRQPETFPLPGNPNILLTRFKWADGSEIIGDPRGFIYLHSSDKSIPDIVIVTVLNCRPTAAWADDGVFSGNPYFQLEPNTDVLLMQDFYSKYILRFIAQLR
ncbi:hypothetical protein [Chitinophaga sp. HK235]|uniref:hypothetical protein n=1 Tax=Chitinophaga sp. HK235 TaxID=2952571 RepID=UPI001BAB1D6E|nr:hypothetical protein [Chitinophaga sp. HK235]